MDQIPEVGDLSAQAKIVSFLESIPQIPDQKAYARITPYMDQIPSIQDRSIQARIVPPGRFEQDRIGPVSQHQTSKGPHQVTVNQYQTFNIKSSGGSTEAEVREAGRDAGQEARNAVEKYFAEEARLSFA